MAKYPTIPDLEHTRYCLGKCKKKTPHTKHKVEDYNYQVNCYYCNYKGNVVA